MMIREGMNVRYSHDTEALVAELMSRPEFFGVSKTEMEQRVALLEPYTYCKTFYIENDTVRPWPCGVYDLRRNYSNIEVTLWKVEDTARQLLQDHGYSCVICRSYTLWCGRRHVSSWDLERAIHDRQTTIAPPLICQDCATDLYVVTNPKTSAFEYYFKRLVGRLLGI